MASVITNSQETITGFLGKQHEVPVLVQFVPGRCIEVCNNPESLRTENNEFNLNSIIALPHIYNGPRPQVGALGDEYRYLPLLRGITEVPAKGDPVLLCTFGNRNYYLGPLNSNNNPNWNEDTMFKPELDLDKAGVENEKIERVLRGQSLNYVKTNTRHLIKHHNKQLDGKDGNLRSVNETHGDLVIEGRHGNSIRMGSRYVNPYIFISNGRAEESRVESLGDGTIIAITQQGTLSQHFQGGYYEDIEIDENNSERQESIDLNPTYILSSDKVENNGRTINIAVQSINQVQDAFPLIYDYGESSNVSNHQILIRSDRIILDSKQDDIYLTSHKDIYIGTGRSLSISTKENLIINSEQTFLGDPNKNGQTVTMERMVLGNVLHEILGDILKAFKEVMAIGPAGPLPLTDNTGAPLITSQLIITPIENKLNKLLSNNHYIEPNE